MKNTRKTKVLSKFGPENLENTRKTTVSAAFRPPVDNSVDKSVGYSVDNSVDNSVVGNSVDNSMDSSVDGSMDNSQKLGKRKENDPRASTPNSTFSGRLVSTLRGHRH